MILLRTWTGIRDHFPVRATEWLMLIPAIGMATVLRFHPNTFSLAASFEQLAEWGDEMTWCVAILMGAVCRLIALTVNGTFKAFRYSPHIRGVSSIICILFWSQWSLGVLVVAWAGAGPWTGVVAYGTFTCIELWNLYRASIDIGKWTRSRVLA